ncbi:MAG: ISAs1 family transposase [Moorea sp. SIO4G2]|nr:ISAs1 family transposase [Moorena sp. SIO4G2]
MIVNSGNDYIAALKGNQPTLFKDVKTNFIPQHTYKQINKGHGRIEKRHVSICQNLDCIRPWPGLTTLIQVKSERQVFTHHIIEVTTETRYYISSLSLTAQEFAERIRGYWGVENKVHYIRDVTQGEDTSRIRTNPLPLIFTIARNFTLNLYRNQMFENMAQAQRLCSFGLDTLKQLFRMK